MTDIYKPRFTNGGDEPSGDASKEEAEREVKDCSRHPSPTYTREELVEIALRGCNHSLSGNTLYRADMKRALDALIAIGAVRVK